MRYLRGILLTLPRYARADDRCDAVDKLFDRWNTSFSPETLEPSLPLAAYAVLYYSADLDTVYTVLIQGQTLSLRTPRGDVLLTLNPGDTYDLRGNMSEGKASGMLVFSKNSGASNGFALAPSGARERPIYASHKPASNSAQSRENA